MARVPASIGDLPELDAEVPEPGVEPGVRHQLLPAEKTMLGGSSVGADYETTKGCASATSILGPKS